MGGKASSVNFFFLCACFVDDAVLAIIILVGGKALVNQNEVKGLYYDNQNEVKGLYYDNQNEVKGLYLR